MYTFVCVCLCMCMCICRCMCICQPVQLVDKVVFYPGFFIDVTERGEQIFVKSFLQKD